MIGQKNYYSMLTDKRILELRKRLLGPSFSLSYREPLHTVQGKGQYLFDANGKRYLDAVNNISHVGHCHPKVISAEEKQARMLNTNTRYLNDIIVNYAQQLNDTLPEGLDVCYFTNSGSESNDLALRMARNFTGSRESIVLNGAYHGQTSALIEISPYKLYGPGGPGAPEFVSVIPMPDPYRGKFRGSDQKAGSQYAGLVLDAIAKIQDDGKQLGLFIAEAIMGSGGQIIYPESFLQQAFEMVKKAGGLCIIDEVQIGFGRTGTHFWGFETCDVTPDIVTMGKPMGNGHPISAVITRRDIADAFDNGMEYFNSFGGNPVSCSIGQAVLDVVREEHLQENALMVGTYLLELLEELKNKHAIIGDVRGKGLFLGVELIKDHDELIPAGNEADLAANLMKDNNILISNDGPDQNVLKIKPPLVFTKDNSLELAETLDRVLDQDNFKIG